MSKLKVGVIGLGKQALEDHIPGVLASNSVELVAVCDSSEQVATSTAQKLGVPGYTNHEQMLDSDSMDFVIVTVPHAHHLAVIESAARRGVHILKEKPFAMSLDQGKAIKELCDRHQIHLMTTLQRRFNPIYASWAQLVTLIGAPFFIDIRYTLFVSNPHVGWRADRAQAGGGCILDMGYHMIDLMMWYFGLPKQVYARLSTKAIPGVEYDAEDTASICMSYPDGAHGVCVFSRYSAPKTEMLRLVGSEGSLELTRGCIRRYSTSGEVLDELTRKHGWPSAAMAQVDYFAGVIRGKNQNIGSPAAHLPHMAFVDACYQSAYNHAAVNPRQLLESTHG